MKTLIRFGAIVLLLLAAQAVPAQTTEFTYQGRLNESGSVANGSYEMQFRLFDNPNAGTGTQQGATITRIVSVQSGIFTVQLDFGANPFSGADIFLEISLRPAGSTGSYTTLAPRQKITSTPYAVKSLTAANADNAQNLGGTAANQFVQTGDPRLSDARTPLAGSGDYIQNTTTQQTSAGFNVDGTGTANVINAATQFNLNNQRILTAATSNLFAGIGAGQSNTLGTNNSFFGFNAGLNNTGNETVGGRFNSFFGTNAGQMLTQSRFNSFFGSNAGGSTTSANNSSFFGANAGSSSNGDNNSFFGSGSGSSNNGSDNSFFGNNAGRKNIGFRNSFFGYESGRQSDAAFTGNDNAFFGWSAGKLNGGSNNSFFGSSAGANNIIGEDNSFFGRGAGFSHTGGLSNSFFGMDAGFSTTFGGSNSFFGRDAGFSNTSGIANSFVGRSAGFSTTNGDSNSFVGRRAGFSNTTGNSNSFFGNNAGRNNTTGNNNTVIGSGADVGSGALTFATAIGADAVVSNSNTIALGRADGSDTVRIFGLGTAGSTTLCRNSSNQISTCSSSRRYKSNIALFADGLNLLNKLNPVSFNWKTTDQADIGLLAEEVAEVEPRLTYKNQNGEIEGVSYSQLSVVLINAVKEQQEQIEAQAAQLEEQKEVILRQTERLNQLEAEIEALKKLIILPNPVKTHEPKNQEKKQ